MNIPKPIKPLARAVLRTIPALERRILPSAGYRRIDAAEFKRLQSVDSGWKASRSANWQLRAYEALVADAEAGTARDDLRIAAEAVDGAGLERPSLLEVGCGGGYHGRIFELLSECEPRYMGTDFSPSMIETARARFPDVHFQVADTTALPFEDARFDIVFDGVSLMHIPESGKAIAEMVRVSASHVILHCVPIFDNHPTEHLFKYAYGEPVTETVHNRGAFERMLRDAGLVIERSWNALAYDVHAVTGAHSHSRTYLCRKTAA